MMNFGKRWYRLIAATGLLVPSAAFATNGYFLIGYGAKSRGMGGVGTAYAQDGLAAAFNPAGMANAGVDTMRVDIGAEFFNPPRAVRQDSAALESGFAGSDGGVNHRSGANLFLIPNLGMIYKFNRKMYIGMAAIGAGLGTRYDQTVPGKPGCLQATTTANGNPDNGVGSTLFNFNCNADSYTVGVSLIQMQVLPSIAYKISKTQTVGASVALAAQQFRAYGLGAFQDLGFAPSKDDVSGRGNDYSYGLGLRFGWTGNFLNDHVTVGANYASRVYMTKFDKYRNLFAEQGGFDIPEHFTVGLAIKPTQKLTFAADVQKIMYSDVRSIGNTGPSATDPGDLNTNGSCAGVPDDIDPDNCKLGGDDGMGFGWKDQLIYKVGLNYDFNSRWSARAGYNYGKSPIRESQVLFNMLAPATVEHHATIGISYRPSRTVEWSFNGMHAFKNTIKGPSAFGPTGDETVDQNVDSIALTMEQWALGLSFAYNL